MNLVSHTALLYCLVTGGTCYYIYFILFCTFYYPFLEIRAALAYLGKVRAATRAALYPVLQVHARSFHASVIRRTMTWTTGSLTAYVIIPTRAYTHTGG